VSHQSADVECREEPLIKELIAAEPTGELFTLDVRGIGDSRPDTCGTNTYLSPYGSDYFYAAHSLMIGQSYPVQRAFDILRVIDWLKSLGRTEIHLVANGWGTIPATLAAVVSNDVKQMTLKQALTSWASIAETDHYKWPLSLFVPGVLKDFDLPDCYRALASKKLKQISPRNASFEEA
jgi:pimeloyl-ACP methyl ester carboxylesterase